MPEFDVSELETLFSAVVPKPADSGSKSGGRRKSVGSKADKVHLVIWNLIFLNKPYTSMFFIGDCGTVS